LKGVLTENEGVLREDMIEASDGMGQKGNFRVKKGSDYADCVYQSFLRNIIVFSFKRFTGSLKIEYM
jgi:hypothetical protein